MGTEELTMKSLKLYFVTIVCFLSTACTGIIVNTDYNPDKNFSAMNRYAWLDISGRQVTDERVENDLMEGRIIRAMTNEFQSRGYQEVSQDQADFLVTYHISSENKLDIDSYYTGYYASYGYYPCWNCYGPYGRVGYNDIRVRQYREGIFMLDVIDPDTKKLMWRGVAERRLSKGTPEERDLYVAETIAAIVAKFPPGQAQ
jgi:hypothetical protein